MTVHNLIEVDTDNVCLVVEDHGGDGPPIVLVHGLSSNLRIWDPLAALLKPNFRVVTVDQRGHGLSGDASPSDWSFAALVSDVDAMCERLGLGRPVICGHSWGASVAAAYAATHADTPGIICVDGGVVDIADWGMDWLTAERALTPPSMDGPVDLVLERMAAAAPLIDVEVGRPVSRRALRVDENGMATRRTPISEHMRIVREIWDFRVDDVFSRIQCPVLAVLASEPSPMLDEKKRATDSLSSRYNNIKVEWTSSVHDIPIHKPADLSRVIQDFLR